MEYTITKDYRISKLILGTVALGMNYGISNAVGQPDISQRFDVLSRARDAGINTLDTARTYGTAEQTIGDYMEENNSWHCFNIISKFKISGENLNSYDAVREEAFKSVRCSLKKLKLSMLPVCLLHMSRKLDGRLIRKHVPIIFRELIAENMIDIAGISVDHPNELEWFEDESVISAYQVPVNIFDHRLMQDDILYRVHRNGKLIFARSVFLQGLFFLNPDQLQGTLTAARPYLLQLHSLAKKEGLTIAELAFSYIRHMPPITSIVFGAESVEQVTQNIRLMNFPALGNNVMDRIKEIFSSVPEDIVTPGNWVM